MAVLGPGSDRPAAVMTAASRRTAADGFFAPRGTPPLAQGKEADEAAAGRRSRLKLPSGPDPSIRGCVDAPIKQTDGDHHDCHHRRRTRTRHHRSHKTCVRPSREGRRDLSNNGDDFVSRRARWGAARSPRGSLDPASMSGLPTPAPISLRVTGEGGTTASTLIWSRGAPT